MNKHKKANPINPVTRKLNAFMNGMENNDMRDVVSNLQAVIEYREEELQIYRKKYPRRQARSDPTSRTMNVGAWHGRGKR